MAVAVADANGDLLGFWILGGLVGLRGARHRSPPGLPRAHRPARNVKFARGGPLVGPFGCPEHESQNLTARFDAPLF